MQQARGQQWDWARWALRGWIVAVAIMGVLWGTGLDASAAGGTITMPGKDSTRTACHANQGRYYEDADGSYGCVLPSGADVQCQPSNTCTVKLPPKSRVSHGTVTAPVTTLAVDAEQVAPAVETPAPTTGRVRRTT